MVGIGNALGCTLSGHHQDQPQSARVRTAQKGQQGVMRHAFRQSMQIEPRFGFEQTAAQPLARVAIEATTSAWPTHSGTQSCFS